MSAPLSADTPSAAGGPLRPPYQPLVIVVVALAVGIVADRYARPVPWLSPSGMAGIHCCAEWAFAAACCFGWLILWTRRKDRHAEVALLLAVAGSGAAWHHWHWDMFPRCDIACFAASQAGPACIEAVALHGPRHLPASKPSPLNAFPPRARSRLRVQVVAIRDGMQWTTAQGICKVTVDGTLTGINAGDRVRIFGHLWPVAPARNPGEFDFAAYARSERCLAGLNSACPECVTLTRKADGAARFRLGRWLDQTRIGCRKLLRQYVGGDDQRLAAAIVLGQKEGLTRETTEPYMVTGTMHVLVVSGLHLGILAGGLSLARRFGLVHQHAALLGMLVVVIGYTLLTGSRPPIVRAAALVGLVCVAVWNRRTAVRFNSLAAAALVVLAINPTDLLQPGPQLSFLAVAALIGFSTFASAYRSKTRYDPLERLLADGRPWYARAGRWLARWTVLLLLSSAVVWVVLLPLVLLQFHLVSIVALALSPLVWPLICMILFGGFGVLVFGWWLPWLAAASGIVCRHSLAMLERVVHIAANIPGGHFWVPGPPWWWVLGIYIGLLGVVLIGARRVGWRRSVVALCVWVTVGFVPALYRGVADDHLRCRFVALGHGICVILEAPTGETVLYDAGSLHSPANATQTIAAALWDRGVLRIDGVILSHADVDHFNGVPGLVDRFKIGQVFVSPVMFDDFGTAAQHLGPLHLRKSLEDAQIPVKEIWAGDRLRIGTEVGVEVLHPPRQGVIGTDNANSVILAIEYAGRRLLLTGDLEPPGLNDVLAELPYDCDVLLAPHHGSRRSDPPGVAAWSSPEWVVISSVGSSSVDSVAATYEQFGATVFRTDRHGTVDFCIGRDGSVAVSTWHER